MSMVANERITITYSPDASTASFNPSSRNIILPLYEGVDADILDGFAIHEVLHAIYTRFKKGIRPEGDIFITSVDGIIEKLSALGGEYFSKERSYLWGAVRSTLNILEDIRIERLGCEHPKYRGISGILARSYNSLWRDNIGGWRTSMISAMSSSSKITNEFALALSHVAQLNAYAKFGSRGIACIAPSDTVIALYKRAVKAETYEDAIELTFQVWKEFLARCEAQYQKEKAKKEEKIEIPFGVLHLNPLLEAIEEDAEEREVSALQEEPKLIDQDDLDKQAKEEEEDLLVEEEESLPEVTISPEDEKMIEDCSAALERSGAIFIHALGGNINTQGKTIFSLQIPEKFPAERVLSHKGHAKMWEEFWKSDEKFTTPEGIANIKEYKDNLWGRYYTNSRLRVSQLISEFMCKKAAFNASKGVVCSTGRLDSRKLALYKSRDDLFVRNIRVPEGKSHGAIILIDWSASMSDKIGKTIVKMLDFVWFCRRMGIPHRVFAFSSNLSANGIEFETNHDTYQKEYRQRTAEESNSLKFDNLVLLEFFTQDMTELQYLDMAKNLLHYGAKHDLYRDPEFNADEAIRKHKMWYVDHPSELELNATPLLQAMAGSIPFLHEMKRTHGTEKNTLFVLTDGADSYGINASYDEIYVNSLFELEDRESGHTARYEAGRNGYVYVNIAEMSQFIQKSTGSSTICMHIIDGGMVKKRRSRSTTKGIVETMNMDANDKDTISQNAQQVMESLRTYGYALSPIHKSWTSYIYVPSSEIKAKIYWEGELQKKASSKRVFVEKISTGLMIREAGAMLARSVIGSMNATILS